MRHCAASLAVLLACAACAAPAAAQGGAGLYEPFPEPTDPKFVRQFVERSAPPGPELARVLTDDQLEHGVRVPGRNLPAGFPLPAARSGGSAARADAGGSAGGALGWVAAGALVALACIGASRLAGAAAPGLARG